MVKVMVSPPHSNSLPHRGERTGEGNSLPHRGERTKGWLSPAGERELASPSTGESPFYPLPRRESPFFSPFPRRESPPFLLSLDGRVPLLSSPSTGEDKGEGEDDCHHRVLACLRGRLPPPDLPFLQFSGCSPEGTLTMEVLDGKEANHREGIIV